MELVSLCLAIESYSERNSSLFMMIVSFDILNSDSYLLPTKDYCLDHSRKFGILHEKTSLNITLRSRMILNL